MIDQFQHGQPDLALAEDRLVGAARLKVALFVVRMRPRDDVEPRVVLARLLDRLPCLEGIGDGNDQRRRRLDIGEPQDIGRRRIALDHLDAHGTGGRGAPLGILDDEERALRFQQPLSDCGPDPAEANQHGMSRQRRGVNDLLRGGLSRGGMRRHREIRFCPLGEGIGVAPEPRLERRPEAFGCPEQQRIEGDGKDGASNDQILRLAIHEAEAEPQRGKDEGEFADLRQRGGDGERGADRAPDCNHGEKAHQRLADEDDEQRAEHRQRIADEDAGIEQHAHGDEEQHREGIAERQAFLRGTLAQLAFAEDHASEEGAERKADPKQVGRARGHPERDGEHGEAEQLAAAGMGRVVQHHGDQPAADDEHEADEGGELDHRDGDDAEGIEPGRQQTLDQADERIVMRGLAAGDDAG